KCVNARPSAVTPATETCLCRAATAQQTVDYRCKECDERVIQKCEDVDYWQALSRWFETHLKWSGDEADTHR
ncbi:MAG: hypothetical protein ACRD2X_25385, partial [Vicinamibacteraceae bacterium]